MPEYDRCFCTAHRRHTMYVYVSAGCSARALCTNGSWSSSSFEGCENRFTGYLRGMCRISNVSFFPLCDRITMYVRACVHVIRLENFIHVHGVCMYFFFVPSCDELPTVVCSTRVEVGHYYRNLTSPKKRKMYVKNDFPPARGRSRSCFAYFETAATVKGVCVRAYVRAYHRRTFVCVCSEYGSSGNGCDSGGGGLLPAFPGRFSHHHGIYVSYINSGQPQYQYHYQSFLRLTNNFVPIQKYGFLNSDNCRVFGRLDVLRCGQSERQ
uniref:Uncharacterized protein n=1 Tax=Sipha flava TaxID=143950 RepID=A0A2S2Q719_9HEMI